MEPNKQADLDRQSGWSEILAFHGHTHLFLAVFSIHLEVESQNFFIFFL